MVGAIGPSRVQNLSGVRSGGIGGSRAGGALTTIAGRVAGRLADELDLDGRGSRRQGDMLDEGDLYDVAGTARGLNGDLGGRPIDEGMLARSLGAFVIESASLIVARPERASFGIIAAAIEDSERAMTNAIETVASALSTIDRTTQAVASSARAT